MVTVLVQQISSSCCWLCVWHFFHHFPAYFLTATLFAWFQFIYSDFTPLVQMQIFPYSVFYIFFEQYLDIWGIALMNIAIALGRFSCMLYWLFCILQAICISYNRFSALSLSLSLSHSWYLCFVLSFVKIIFTCSERQRRFIEKLVFLSSFWTWGICIIFYSSIL